MINRSREEKFGKALHDVSGVLPVRPVSLAKPGLRGTLVGFAGVVLTVLTAIPFLGAPAKASIQQWIKADTPNGAVLNQQSRDPVKYLRIAAHTDVAHSNSTQHGDQTDPWGTHIDTDPVHTDSPHTNS